MRDLPFYERHYPMTLAETASIFAETLLRDYLLETLPDDQKVGIAWENAASAEGFMLNIPSRFEFEKSLVETRKGKNATADEMKELMNSAWGKWYEDSLSEYDNLFWANKLHFHMSGLGFYNYPYLFGYLFSLGVYAQKQKWGEEFYPKYVALLRDTGKMTAEQVIQKHLGKDITQKEFWQDSISIVEKNIEQFRKLAGF
jgi:oligoendopeptidase F